jgi:hypothetical protein
MPVRTALILLAASALAAVTASLLVLLFAPELALLVGIGVYLAAGRISRQVWGIGLAVAALIVWRHLTRKNGDQQ